VRKLIRIKRFLILILILLLTQSSYAGTSGKITGQVTDERGEPLPGASIIIEGTTRGTTTDNEGVYFILSADPGRHNLIASMIGYESQRKEEVLVTSDFTTNMAFELKEQTLQLGEIVVEAQEGATTGGMFSLRSKMPLVEPDKTTSKYIVRDEDIEAIPIIRDMQQFIELQAGVTVDEEGDELTIRAGAPQDMAYYVDGVPLPTTDHAEPRVIGMLENRR